MAASRCLGSVQRQSAAGVAMKTDAKQSSIENRVGSGSFESIAGSSHFAAATAVLVLAAAMMRP